TPPFGVAPILAISIRLPHRRLPLTAMALADSMDLASRTAFTRVHLGWFGASKTHLRRFGPVRLGRTGRFDIRALQPEVGVTNCAPARMLDGQRVVTVFTRV